MFGPLRERLPWNALDARQRRVLIVVALILGSAGIAAAASHLANAPHTSGEIPITAPNGPTVIVVDAGQVVLPGITAGSDTVDIVSTEGNITVNGSASASVTVDTIEGTWTNTSSLSVVGAPITMDPGDKSAVSVSGDITALDWRQGMASDDGTADFVYDSSLGSGSVTLNGLTASTEYAAVDASSGTVLDVATSDGSGALTFSGLDAGSHDVVLQTSAGGPTVSGRSPADGALLDSTTVTLEADVSDPDFPGDEVTVEWYVDGSLEATDTITSNQSLSQQVSVGLGGTHTWHLEMEDAYGNTVTTANFTMESPGVLYIRNESDPSQLVNDTTVQITAYYSGNVQRRNVSDGTLELTNFPVDEPLIIRANASGYHTRTAVIESVFMQNSIFLLPSNVSTYLVRFDLQDPTGDYPREDTVIFVDRDLELNGSVEWRVIAGDNFGVQGVPVTLAQNERYRIRIRNLETEQTAVIGAFTAIQSETVTVSPGKAIVEIADGERDYAWEITKDDDAQEIVVEYVDTANLTDSIKITIHERFNESVVLVDNATFSSNDLVYQKSLTNAQVNKTWTAQLYIDRGDGYMHFRVPVSGGPRSLIPAGLDSVWVSAIGVFIMLMTGMAFSTLNKGQGAIVTSLVGGFLWFFGVFSGTAAAVAITLALAISIFFHYQWGGS